MSDKRECVGVEPTGDQLDWPPNGFEDRGTHRDPSTPTTILCPILVNVKKSTAERAEVRLEPHAGELPTARGVSKSVLLEVGVLRGQRAAVACNVSTVGLASMFFGNLSGLCGEIHLRGIMRRYGQHLCARFGHPWQPARA